MTGLEDLREAGDLDHIVQAIDQIVEWTTGMAYAAFVANRIVRAAVVRNLEIAADACAQLLVRFPEFAEQNPDCRCDRRGACGTGSSMEISTCDWIRCGPR